jgi:hypothetical protein
VNGQHGFFSERGAKKYRSKWSLCGLRNPKEVGSGAGERLEGWSELSSPLANDVRLVDHEGAKKAALGGCVDSAREGLHQTLGRGEDDRLRASSNPLSDQLSRPVGKFAVIGQFPGEAIAVGASVSQCGECPLLVQCECGRWHYEHRCAGSLM